MYPFPATLDGAPVTVYQLTEDRHACIARADGRLDYVLVTSLRVAAPTPDDEPDEPTKPPREGFATIGDAQEACKAFSAERGDEQPHRGNP